MQVDLDAPLDEYGHTSLLVAAMHGRTNLVHLLLRLGADPRAQRPAHGGATAASAAAARGHADVLAALAEAGADVESQGSEGLTPVDYLLRRAWAALEAVSGDFLEAAVAPHAEAARQGLAHLALQEDSTVPRAPCHAATAPPPPAVLTRLIAPDAAHVGAGSFVVDGGFDEAFLQRLLHTFGTLPLAPRIKASQGLNDRAYLSDAEGGRAVLSTPPPSSSWERRTLPPPLASCFLRSMGAGTALTRHGAARCRSGPDGGLGGTGTRPGLSC